MYISPYHRSGDGRPPPSTTPPPRAPPQNPRPQTPPLPRDVFRRCVPHEGSLCVPDSRSHYVLWEHWLSPFFLLILFVENRTKLFWIHWLSRINFGSICWVKLSQSFSLILFCRKYNKIILDPWTEWNPFWIHRLSQDFLLILFVENETKLFWIHWLNQLNSPMNNPPCCSFLSILFIETEQSAEFSQMNSLPYPAALY